ncbi:hypothetical protein KFK09_004981 [Dendrobium nobile]|uniref:Uncharacterized protein n=1 Tax=Dendrobium nobile TaxID=94219 RepID=A0A8T3BXV7_DENNO|nr:hypothetical protein KFK09_004981 [Dendrobium nobile]
MLRPLFALAASMVLPPVRSPFLSLNGEFSVIVLNNKNVFIKLKNDLDYCQCSVLHPHLVVVPAPMNGLVLEPLAHPVGEIEKVVSNLCNQTFSPVDVGLSADVGCSSVVADKVGLIVPNVVEFNNSSNEDVFDLVQSPLVFDVVSGKEDMSILQVVDFGLPVNKSKRKNFGVLWLGLGLLCPMEGLCLAWVGHALPPESGSLHMFSLYFGSRFVVWLDFLAH